MSALQKILIKTRRQIFSEVPANNPSIFEGEGFDFVELREYTYGDDVRKIDWNVTAKKQRPYVRIFREERELNIAIAVLSSGSIYFGSKRLKQDLIAEIVALLAFSSVKNSDRFALYTYDSDLHTIVRATKHLHAVNRAVESILNLQPIGKRVDHKQLSKHLFEQLKRRSILFLVGDFFHLPDLRLLAKKHEVIALITRDKLEENPPDLGMMSLSDPATLQNRLLSLEADSLDHYKKRLAKHDYTLYEHFRKNRIAFTKIYTDESPFVKLSKLFLRRS